MVSTAVHRSVFVCLAAALCLVAMPSTAQEEVRLQGLAGGELRSSELERGTHVVVFWTSWSPRGRDIVAKVNAVASRWGGGARVVTVNFQEEAPAVRDFLAGQSRMNAPVFLDVRGALSKRYRVNSAPWLLVLRDGRTAFSDRLPNDPDSVLAELLR